VNAVQDHEVSDFINRIGKSVDILPEAALALFDASQFRLADAYGGDKRLQISFDAEWMDVSREDLYGQCATYLTGNDLEKLKASFRKCIRYGLRIDREKPGFFCIDTLTDG